MEPRTISQIHDAFDQGSLSPVEFTRGFLERARASKLNAFLTLAEDRAMEQARRAQDVLERTGKVPRQELPLLGIPLAIKDNLVVEGVRTTCASRILENYVPPYTATAVERLEAAGAVILGKTNLDEFGMGGSNENSAFGPVQHPTHPDRVPGGSSGGSAAAVRADLAWAAIGSDTGGSIRLPASFCGVVGFKPTYGRVSRYGLVAFASSLDTVGPLARSVQDAALLFSVMGVPDPRDSTSVESKAEPAPQSLQGLRIGVPDDAFGPGVGPAVEAATRAALRLLEDRGAHLVPVRLPHARHSVAVYYLVAVSEASSNLARFDGVRFGTRPQAADRARDLAEFYRQVRSAFGPEVKRRILLGTFALSSGYQDAYYRRACQVRRLIQQDFDSAFAQVDLIATPVSPTTAFRLGEKSQDPLQMYLNDLYTIPANLAGLPAISVPCGQDSQQLPIGLQLTGPAFGDGRVLAAAQWLQEALS